LSPTPELWTKVVKFRTQILYPTDMSLITLYLGLKPGLTVIESGTGSGAFSTVISRSIAPTGRLLTFEFNEERVVAANEDFKKNGLDKIITSVF